MTDDNNENKEKSQSEQEQEKPKKEDDKIKCSWCGKEFPRKDLKLVWDSSNGDGWHYCHGTWRYTYYSSHRNCCGHSDRPLFLCSECYQLYKERKAWKRSKQPPLGLIFGLIIGVVMLSIVLSLVFWLPWPRRRWGW